MKKLLLLFALAATFISSASAQAPKRVLVEEFTSSTCGPCAITDPIMEEFEAGYMDKICVLKWHVNWPAPGNDPFYWNYQLGRQRAIGYYGVQGVPDVYFNGANGMNPGSGVSALEAAVDDAAANASPFTIDIQQAIEGDSIIVNLTVKCVDAPPAATDLRLGAVIAERFAVYQGTNGRAFHTSAVRTVIPGLTGIPTRDTGGAVIVTPEYPAFSIAQGETKTYRYAARIGNDWNRKSLMAVAFIQSAGSKEIYQSNWTVPSITVNGSSLGTFTVVPYPLTLELGVNNATSSPVDLKIEYAAADLPSGWTFEVVGSTEGTISLAANEEKTIEIKVLTPEQAIGSAIGGFYISTADGKPVGGAATSFFGEHNDAVILDEGAGPSAMTATLKYLQTTKGMKIGLADRGNLNDYYPDWSRFKTVIFAAGNTTGLYTNYDDWDRIAAHLDAGGNFLMTSGIAVGAYFRSGDESLMDLWRENFHIEPVNYSTTSWTKINGVPGDPIGDGIATALSANPGYRQPLKPADAAFRSVFMSEKKDTIGMRALSSNGKVAYLSFGLEMLDQADMETIGGRIIDWFNGAASVKTGDVASNLSISNYPNPVSKTATFSYSITEPTAVSLAVYDVMGREVARIINGESHTTGTYEADLDASKLANGSYTYMLTAGAQKVSGTMLVQK